MMKRFLLEYAPAWILLFVLGLIVVHAPFTVYVSSHWPEATLYVKSWKELLILGALLLLAAAYTVRRAWGTIVRDKLLWLVVVYGALHLFTAFYSHTPLNSIIAGLMIDLRYIAYFIAVYMFVKLYPSYAKSFFKIGLLGATIVVGFAVLQLALPHDFLKYLGYGDATIQPYLTVDKNPAFVRENSTLRGPNPLGAYAVMVIGAVVMFGIAAGRTLTDKRQKYLHLFLAAASVISLWVSYSRSAWAAAVVTVAIIVWVKYFRVVSRRTILLATGVVCVAALGLFVARDTYFVKNVIIHDNPSTGAAIDSNAGHATSLATGAREVLSQPFGSGIGSTGSASLLGNVPLIVENQFLFVGHEVGWFGLVLFLGITGTVLYRLWMRRRQWWALALFASGVGLLIIGLLLPVWADDTVSIVWWGLAAVALAWEKERKKHGTTSNKKAKRAA